MRKLMWCAVGYCGALALGHYFISYEYLLWFALVCAISSALAFLLNEKARKTVLISFLSAAVGFTWLCAHNELVIRPAEALIGRTLEVDARVIDYPQLYDEYSSAEIRLTEDWVPEVKVKVYDYNGAFSELRPGDEILIELEFISARILSNVENDYYLSDGTFLRGRLEGDYEVTGKWFLSFLHTPKHLAHGLKAHILKLFPDDVAPLMKAMLTGDKSELYKDDGLYTAMKTAGFSHIIAVSGMHVSFILGLLRLWTGRRRRYAVIGIPLVWFFAAMSGFSPSVVRASAMMSLMLIAPMVRRENDAPTSLSASLLILTLVNPESIGSISLQLSFCAMAGIILVSPAIYAQLNKFFEDTEGIIARPLRAITASFSSSVGAIVFTTPLMALHFGFVPLYSVLTNMLCLWAMSAAFMAAYPICILGTVYFPLGNALAWLLAWLPRYTIVVVKFIAELPYAALPAKNNYIAWWLVFVYAVLLFPLLCRRDGKYRPLIPICCCVLGFIAAATVIDLSSYKGPQFTALDVGQGQCLVMTENNTTVLIDCGSKGNSENAGDIAADHLLTTGQSSIDLLILTHLHADHANGVARLLNRIDTRRLVIPVDCEDTEYRDSILDLCYDKNIEVYTLESDSFIRVGNFDFSIYAPIGSENANENGLIILGEIEDYRFLVTGDAGEETEQLFISFYEVGDIDLLVAGHHGSSYSSCTHLLEETTPETAVISVGLNSYGHPSQEVLDRFVEYGIEVRRTDLEGNITVRIGNENG